MKISLHKMARTTPTVHAEIAASPATDAALAGRLGIPVMPLRTWSSRDSSKDRSHTAHRHQTVINRGQAIIAVHLRYILLSPLDGLLAVMRALVCPEASGSGLGRCLVVVYVAMG